MRLSVMGAALATLLVAACGGSTGSQSSGMQSGDPPPGNPQDTYAPCAGKACGQACTVCAPDARDCAETMVLKACDATGHCVTAPAVCG